MSEEKQTGTGLVGQPFNYAQLVSYRRVQLSAEPSLTNQRER